MSVDPARWAAAFAVVDDLPYPALRMLTGDLVLELKKARPMDPDELARRAREAARDTRRVNRRRG